MVKSSKPSGNKKWSFALLFVATLLSAFHFYLASYHTLLIGFKDIDVFLYSTLTYLRTGYLYDDTGPLAITYAAGRSILKFPPLYVAPYLHWIDASSGVDHRIYLLLFSLHVLRYLLVMLLCGFFLGPFKNPRWWMLLIIVFAFCAPFYEALYGLTFDNLFLFILAIALVLLRYRQQFLPVAFLTYAASVKLYPVIQLIPLLMARNWRRVFYCLVMLLLYLCVSLGLFGREANEFYYFHILPVLLQEKVVCETGNLSIAAQFCSVQAPVWILKLFFIGTTLAVAWRHINKNIPCFENESLLYAFFICLPLLIMQNLWGNYQVILLLPVSVLLGYAFAQRGLSRSVVMTIALLAWLPLIASDNYPAMDLFYYSWLGADLPRLMIDHLKPYSALLLWLVLGFLLLGNKFPAKPVSMP